MPEEETLPKQVQPKIKQINRRQFLRFGSLAAAGAALTACAPNNAPTSAPAEAKPAMPPLLSLEDQLGKTARRIALNSKYQVEVSNDTPSFPPEDPDLDLALWEGTIGRGITLKLPLAFFNLPNQEIPNQFYITPIQDPSNTQPQERAVSVNQADEVVYLLKKADQQRKTVEVFINCRKFLPEVPPEEYNGFEPGQELLHQIVRNGFIVAISKKGEGNSFFQRKLTFPGNPEINIPEIPSPLPPSQMGSMQS